MKSQIIIKPQFFGVHKKTRSEIKEMQEYSEEAIKFIKRSLINA